MDEQAQGMERREQADPVPLLDSGQLDRLSRHIGAAAMRELLAEGRAELADRLTRLSHPAAGEDVGRLAHQVCGLAGSLGLPLVARHAARAAEAARAECATGGALAALMAMAGPSLAALEAWDPPAGDGAAGARRPRNFRASAVDLRAR